MLWKNLGPRAQSLIFGAAVGFGAWLLSPYLGGTHYGDGRCDDVPAQIGARNHSGGVPPDLSSLRLLNEGRRP